MTEYGRFIPDLTEPTDEEWNAAQAANRCFDEMEEASRALHLLEEVGRSGIRGVTIDADAYAGYEAQLARAMKGYSESSAAVGAILTEKQREELLERELPMLPNLSLCTAEELESFARASGFPAKLGSRTFHCLARYSLNPMELRDPTLYDPDTFVPWVNEVEDEPRVIKWRTQRSPRHGVEFHTGIDRASMLRAREAIAAGKYRPYNFGDRQEEVLAAYCGYIEAMTVYSALIAEDAQKPAASEDAESTQ